jgi:hypothetical protein
MMRPSEVLIPVAVLVACCGAAYLFVRSFLRSQRHHAQFEERRPLFAKSDWIVTGAGILVLATLVVVSSLVK